MRRKTAFKILLPMVLLEFTIIVAIAIVLQTIWILGIAFATLILSGYSVYILTYKHKPKYPMVPPDGKPDVYYRYGIPRPIYEDMERHPWFFKKRKPKMTKPDKKVKKKH